MVQQSILEKNKTDSANTVIISENYTGYGTIYNLKKYHPRITILGTKYLYKYILYLSFVIKSN